MTKVDTQDKCLFLLSKDGFRKGVHDSLKQFDAVFNNVGWFVDISHRDHVEKVREITGMQLEEWPLHGESFKDLKRRHNKDFFIKKSIETGLKIDSLKAEMGMSSLDNKVLMNEKRESLENTPIGQQLLKLLETLEAFNKKLSHAEEDEALAQIKVPPSQLKLQFIHQISQDYFKTKPPEKPVLLEYVKDGDRTARKIPFLHKGIVGMIVAEGGRGKTHLVAMLAASVVTGVPFLEKFQIRTPGSVCLIVGENDSSDIRRLLWKIRELLESIIEKNASKKDHERFSVFKNALDRMDTLLCPVSVHGINASLVDARGDKTAFFNHLLEQLKENEPEDGWQLIVLDPASRFSGPESEKDNAIATAFIACLENISESLKGKPTILLSHHKSKSAIRDGGGNQADARGSSGLTDGVRWQANLSKGESNEQSVLEVTKTNFTEYPERIILNKRKDGVPEFLKWENESSFKF